MKRLFAIIVMSLAVTGCATISTVRQQAATITKADLIAGKAIFEAATPVNHTAVGCYDGLIVRETEREQTTTSDVKGAFSLYAVVSTRRNAATNIPPACYQLASDDVRFLPLLQAIIAVYRIVP